ncbi:hypothetical protein GALMADRAFT_585745 [Galerina marginata CBS 339.88]|uniref:Uncharacterized protein n=1 Tax=Galerina marginata (strain CBS 339.88) TaxID=685588 RepID=A0A067SU74_GALM3|nr:hypothetical protein GALMADRAFT_585745 [Galerina marginata CBS 339.88]
MIHSTCFHISCSLLWSHSSRCRAVTRFIDVVAPNSNTCHDHPYLSLSSLGCCLHSQGQNLCPRFLIGVRHTSSYMTSDNISRGLFKLISAKRIVHLTFHLKATTCSQALLILFHYQVRSAS